MSDAVTHYTKLKAHLDGALTELSALQGDSFMLVNPRAAAIAATHIETAQLWLTKVALIINTEKG